METVQLDASRALGVVHLTVADLQRSLEFYQKAIGFQVHRIGGDTARLGVGERDLLALTAQPGARKTRGTTGLYHFAVLVPSRRHLAAALQNLVDTQTPITGGSDHLVSEALYLDDPDGNGIEIYRDRPRAQWPVRDGRLQMATERLDYQGLLGELEEERSPWQGLDSGTVIGHIHLHVADLAAAQAFYRDVVGLEVITSYGPSATFLAAGGYHHHVGLNTWAGVGAPPAPAGSVGLRYFTFRLADEEQRERLFDRVTSAGIDHELRDGLLTLGDPSANSMVFEVA